MGREKLKILVCHQLKNFFMVEPDECVLLEDAFFMALERVERCFSQIANKYYFDEKGALFNPFHSGQYSIFLYFLSREAWMAGEGSLADKVYYLNKTLNSFDLFYEIEMPDIFFLDHPYSSVLGRAKYSDFFIFQQNCTVGNNRGVYPTFGEYVWLFANAAVIGDCNIGNNVFISAGSYVKDTDIPDNTIVFGKSPDLILKSKEVEYFYAKSPFGYHRELLDRI